MLAKGGVTTGLLRPWSFLGKLSNDRQGHLARDHNRECYNLRHHWVQENKEEEVSKVTGSILSRQSHGVWEDEEDEGRRCHNEVIRVQEEEEYELRRGSQLSHWVSVGQQGYCQDKVGGVQEKNEDIVTIKSSGSGG